MRCSSEVFKKCHFYLGFVHNITGVLRWTLSRASWCDPYVVATLLSNLQKEETNSMRKQLNDILKQHFQKNVKAKRKMLGISQEDMADRLLMAGRTYIDLEQ